MSSEMSPIVHFVPLQTGGVDRYVRDICSVRTDDWIVHIAEERVIVERPQHAPLVSVETTSWIELLRDRQAFAAIHAHSTLAPVRELATTVAAAASLPMVLTLHDIDFVGDDVDERERIARIEFAARATDRIAPSEYIADLWRALGRKEIVRVVEHGVDNADVTVDVNRIKEYLPSDARFDYVVIGALGQHKGRERLEAIAALRGTSSMGLVVGYTDNQLVPGWRVKDSLWCTGPFAPEEVSQFVSASGARIALFPNVQPESFCYALSDAWRAGLPALAPDSGALGERIRKTQAGWLFDASADIASVSRHIDSALREASSKSAVVRGLSTTSIVESVKYTYSEICGREPHADKDDISWLSSAVDTMGERLDNALRKHLDTSLMRKEMIRLSGELAFAQRQIVVEEAASRRNRETNDELLSSLNEARRWHDKLLNDVDEAQKTSRDLEARLRETVEKYEGDVRDLRQALKHYRSKLRWVPQWIRRFAKLS
jgi:glycosyltransferase involved in cell wall biosynthesis